MNDDIKEYTTPSGKIRYKFSIYVGKDEATGHSIQARKGGFKNYDEALKSYEAIKEKVKDGTYTGLEIKKYKVSDVYNLWIDSYKDTVKTSTFINVKQFFTNHILKDLGDYYVERLTPFKCQSVAKKWSNELPKSFGRLIMYTDKLLDFAVKFDIIRTNPMRRIIKPKEQIDHKPFTDFYSKEELIQFLNACKKTETPKIFMFFRLLSFTGMRVGEALALKWSDVDFKNNLISINKTVSTGEKHSIVISDTTKTVAGMRTISIDYETMALLSEWRFQQRRDLFKLGFNPFNQDQLIFQNRSNGVIRPNLVGFWNRRICKKNGLRRIKVHGFRHTHASLLFQEGARMKDVQERLGHKSITTTMNIYTHVTKSHNSEIANNFGKFMEM